MNNRPAMSTSFHRPIHKKIKLRPYSGDMSRYLPHAANFFSRQMSSNAASDAPTSSMLLAPFCCCSVQLSRLLVANLTRCAAQLRNTGICPTLGRTLCSTLANNKRSLGGFIFLALC